MVPVWALCNKHLTGEHVEHHMFVGSLQKQISMDGYVANNLMEPLKLRERHDALAVEMGKRGMNHKSPLPEYSLAYLPEGIIKATVDVKSSWLDLVGRCPDCKARYEALSTKIRVKPI